jgi:dethiobiotin synthetase
VWKPVETGWDPGAEAATDAARLRRAAESSEPLDVICPYRLREPLAPSVAARLQGVAIDLGHLATCYAALATRADVVLVEGAGGLLVPLARRATYVDLARDLGLAVLIVGANRLGVVNHTALTARAAAAAGLAVAGFALNQTAPAADPSVTTNRATIEEVTGLPCLADLPYAADPFDSDRLADRLDLAGLLAALRSTA